MYNKKKPEKYNFEYLEIYQLANAFAVLIYSTTRVFPQDEVFGLVSQIRRAAVSVLLNIVEGSGRSSNKDYSRFISLAIGSLFEVKAALILSHQLKDIGDTGINNLLLSVDELFFKLSAFKKSLIAK